MTADRALGRHAACGGEIVYRSTPSQGWRVCLECGQDSRARFSLMTESELESARQRQEAKS